MNQVIRYTTKVTNLSLVETIKRWWRLGDWSRTKSEYIALKPGDEGYSDAPLEAHWICHSDAAKLYKANN